MLVLPKHLEGLTIWPACGKIELKPSMSKEEALEAQKIYPEIKWVEPEKKKKKGGY